MSTRVNAVLTKERMISNVDDGVQPGFFSRTQSVTREESISKAPGMESARQLFMCQTRDKHTIFTSRFRPSKESDTQGKHAVVLVHGFACNRLTFNLHEKVSVAKYLASKGWDTYVVDLRGSGRSKQPRPHSETPHDWFTHSLCDIPEESWTYQDHIEDVRAVVQMVFDHTKTPVHLIGHSMGSMLVLNTALSENENNVKLVKSCVCIAGSFAMETSKWKNFMWLWGVVKHLHTLHPEVITKRFAPMSLQIGNPWDQLFFQPGNVDVEMANLLFQKNWEPIPVSLIGQLRWVVSPRGMYEPETHKYYQEELQHITVPVLCVAGTHDEQCPPEEMRRASSLIPGSKFACFGKRFGTENDYGHFDLLIGKNAKTEVWDFIHDFLTENDIL